MTTETTPTPFDCSIEPGMFASTFGRYEIESAALRLVVLSQKNGVWLSGFTPRDVNVAACWLDQLVECGYLAVTTTRRRRFFFWTAEVPSYTITDAFAEKVYRAQQRNLRIWDPNTKTRESDLMRAVGMLPD